MPILGASLTSSEISSAIIRDPLTVAPDTMLIDLVARMSQIRANCMTPKAAHDSLASLHGDGRSSCVIVVADRKVMGILTERDIVRLSAQQKPLDRVTVGQVMVTSVITLRESAFTNLLMAVNLLQQHHIRHLPLLNDRDCLVGLVTHESLCQNFRPIDLLRLRVVSEVMASQVVYAAPNASMLSIVQQMATHRVSSVVIVEPGGPLGVGNGGVLAPQTAVLTPIGIVTERDVVQFHALGLDLQTCAVRAVMSTPLHTVKPTESLWKVQQIMSQYFIHRLAVTGEQDELLGIITQSSLLKAFNPLELYNLVEVLESRVERLEAEARLQASEAALRKAERQFRKAAEKLLQDREARYYALMNGASDAIILTDQQGNLLEVNHQVEKLLGYSRSELMTMHITALHLPEEVPNILAGFKEFIRQQSSRVLDLTFLRKDGQTVLVNMSVSIIEIDGKKIIQAICRDITERRQAELERQALIQELATLKLGMDQAAIVAITDPQGVITYVNDLFCRTSGYAARELIGQTHRIVNSGYHPPEFFKEMWRTISRGNVWRGEICNRTKDGRIYWVDSTLVPFIDHRGKPLQYLAIRIDITARKVAEAALRESEILFRQVFDSNVVGMMFTSFGGQITEANDRFLEMLGYTREDLVENQINWATMTPPEYRQQDLEVIEQLQQWDSVEPWEKAYYHKEGHAIPVMVGVALLSREKGTCVCVVLDISERKRMEDDRYQAQQLLTERNQQLAVSNAELERATRLKDEFLANMSHELRTPLNAILGMTEGLQEQVFGTVNERQMKALQTIERSGSHLLALINDILDVAKVESGQIHLDCAPTSVALLCQSSLAFIQQQALKKRIQLEMNLPPDLPDLLVDERRIRQVLINLLNNAVKFTPEMGRITLKVSRQPQTIDFLEIAVIDTGTGIASEHLKKLFQPFVQIDSALNRQYSGTGLGLALVKRIVELHGGQVGVSSEVGVGSCFTIYLPCVPTCSLPLDLTGDGLFAVPERDGPEGTQPGATQVTGECAPPLILLAEDNEANIHTVSSYLEVQGYRLLLAKSGQEAIDLARAEHPALILMDIQMPGMDGLEATRQIRLHPELAETPIVALTALAMSGDRDRCLAAGVNEYLWKPVRLKELVATIRELLASRGES